MRELQAEAAFDRDEWFDGDGLGRRYLASKTTILRWADIGRIPWGIKLGGLRRWSRREIEEWEAGGCKPVRTPGAGR